MPKNVCINIIPSSLKMVMTQMSNNSRTDKKFLAYSFIGLLYKDEKQITAICNSMDKSCKYNVKQRSQTQEMPTV